jgi:two-component system chemotaxis response regulator CheY
MNLATQLAAAREKRSLTRTEWAQHCCDLAKNFERAGEYEAAGEALTEFWPERQGQPTLEGLDQQTAAEVLLRVGALAGWLGSARQAERSQETAKNLITQSIEIFAGLGESERVAEARSDLALCYWREGAFDEARINLVEALDRLKNENSDLKASVLIRSGIVEVKAGRFVEALRFYEKSAALVERSTEHALKGSFHISLGTVFSRLAAAENREDYLDRSLIEYAAASFHFEHAAHTRQYARVENNLGFLFSTIGRFKEAHEHIDRARGLFSRLGDRGHVAQVDDTRARTLLAQGLPVHAERIARAAVRTLDRGDECSLLVEALTTYATALARTGKDRRSRSAFERAIAVAETCGDLEGAGRANLSMIEELGDQTSAMDLAAIYKAAVDLLQRSQDPSATKRLLSCATKVIDALGGGRDDEDAAAKRDSWEGFSFKQQIVKSEKALIERALRDARGSVTKAARLLGFNHHQSLIALINSRHKDLLQKRSAVQRRRQHLFSKPKKAAGRDVSDTSKVATSQISILQAEDNQMLASVLGEMFATEQWRVELCADGGSALDKLAGRERYDLLLFDNDLPGLSGLELVLRARSMPHRRRTPIIMLSGNDCEAEAWRAGVDAFLRKPKDIDQVLSAIARLLKIELKAS